ncbi:MAG: hypothetical protein GTO18_00705 [Anaerolineales bacterium]|nr:hypothetical protein [Anaerolineales bacterium]
MKIYISVDMEGIACVTHVDHIRLEGGEYQAARKWMTAEANAAIEGAFDGGATEIVIADGHGQMHNLIPDDLHEDVTLVRGVPRPLLMMEGIDDTFVAALFIGYHALAGSSSGILAHSFSGQNISEIRLNGDPVSEALFNAAVAGHFGVPIALISGDDALAAEIEKKLPWVKRVVTKWALSSTAARNLTPKAAQDAIRKSAKHALSKLDSMKPLVMSAPIQFDVDFRHPIQAYLVSDIPGVERTSGTSVSYSGADMVEISSIWRLMLNTCMNKSPL